MKAVILEIRDGMAAALREDGVVVKTRAFGTHTVGETIELTAEVKPVLLSRRRRFARSAVAALLALAVTGGGLTYMTTDASAYVSLDTEETSVEVSVNHFGRVIGVRALDENSEALAGELAGEMRHRRLEDALGAAAEHLGARQDAAGGVVLAAVTSPDDTRSAALTETVRRCFERGGEGMQLRTMTATPEQRRFAAQQEQSPGRYLFEQHYGQPFAPQEGQFPPPPPPQGDPFGPGMPADRPEPQDGDPFDDRDEFDRIDDFDDADDLDDPDDEDDR